jgi:hypothetical protein
LTLKEKIHLQKWITEKIFLFGTLSRYFYIFFQEKTLAKHSKILFICDKKTTGFGYWNEQQD